MKKILILLLLFVGAKLSAQIPFEMGAIKIDSAYNNDNGLWIKNLADQDSIDRHTDTLQSHNVRLKALANSTASDILQDSVDKHTDTLQLHNSRLKVMELIDHTHANKDTLDATTAAFTIARRLAISKLNDSTAKHTDTLQLHNTRIKVLENDTGGGTGDVLVSGTTTANYSAVWNGTDSTLVSRHALMIYADSTRANHEIHAFDSIRMNYAKPIASGTRFVVLTSGAAQDTGVLNAVSRGLTDSLWDIIKQLADVVNGEIRWIHIDDVTRDTVGTYGLPNGMDAFEALQYTTEMSLRLIAKQDLLITELNKRVAKLEKGTLGTDAKLYLGFISFLIFLAFIIVAISLMLTITIRKK